ncbi:MAG: winged helix-turn-helix domain-containing protein [candidate division NC10 bacterium]|nr:winged helix-turn-helix domain-containing protein [candidate division NC10 bacterium]
MTDAIGHAAGEIWRYLEKHGKQTVSQLQKGTKLSSQILYLGLGWLAREDKITFIQERRSVWVSLRGGS